MAHGLLSTTVEANSNHAYCTLFIQTLSVFADIPSSLTNFEEEPSATLGALFHLQSVDLSTCSWFKNNDIPQKIGFRTAH
jgi:hypothetical protein